MKMKLAHLVISMALLSSTASVFSYGYYTSLGNPVKWSSENPKMRADEDDFTSGSSLRSALEEVVSRINQNPSDLQMDLSYESSVWFLNAQNEVWFTDSDFWLNGASGVTWWTAIGTGMIEADIMLDSRETWATSHSKIATMGYGGARPLQTVLLHEFGHAIALAHENDEYNIMGQDWTHVNANNNLVNYYPGEDACDGLVFLYGLDSTHREDVGVVHWKYSGYSGEYSLHTRTKVYRSDGVACSKVSGTDDDPVYKVSTGHTILLELTFENNGATSQTPHVRYYLSTDNQIRTSDTVLASRTPTVGRNSVYTTTQLLTIPSSLTSGTTYYLGAIVDYDNLIDEVNEDNNATYVGIYIK